MAEKTKNINHHHFNDKRAVTPFKSTYVHNSDEHCKRLMENYRRQMILLGTDEEIEAERIEFQRKSKIISKDNLQEKLQQVESLKRDGVINDDEYEMMRSVALKNYVSD